MKTPPGASCSPEAPSASARGFGYMAEEGSQACSPPELQSEEGRSGGHIVGTATFWPYTAFFVLTIAPSLVRRHQNPYCSVTQELQTNSP